MLLVVSHFFQYLVNSQQFNKNDSYLKNRLLWFEFILQLSIIYTLIEFYFR
jgi:hypothetical protein